MLTLPLYTGLLWLLATEARHPTRRVWLALPVLVLWGNMHGSAALGALLVMLLGAYELVCSRGAIWLRSLALIVLAPLAILVTPYGPVTTARYYHLLLVDPPFKGLVTEWRWPAPATNTYAFYVLLALAVPIVVWGRRRLTAFDMAVLALTLAGALTAIRGIPWFAFACMVFVPVAVGRSAREPQARRAEARAEPSPSRPALATALVSRGGLALPPLGRVVRGLLADGLGRRRPGRPPARRPRIRPGPVLRLDALQDPGAARTHRLRRPLRDLRQGVLRPALRLQLGAAATGSRSPTATGSSSSTRRIVRTLPTS